MLVYNCYMDYVTRVGRLGPQVIRGHLPIGASPQLLHGLLGNECRGQHGESS